MARAKNSDDLDEIIAGQLDKMSGGKVTEDDLKRAETIAKLIGKQIKKDSLRLTYFGMQKKAPPPISTFEVRGKK
jgi:benzoyl-CoA reductase/2-hydroxyglutaryl-CoA dehydratase subunit BcrC/BadD/HgdB